MEQGKRNPYIEMFFKSTFYVLVGIPVILGIALLSLCSITLWQDTLITVLKWLIARLPLVWLAFSVAVFLSGGGMWLFARIKKRDVYKKHIKKLVITSGVFIVMFVIGTYAFIIPLISSM